MAAMKPWNIACRSPANISQITFFLRPAPVSSINEDTDMFSSRKRPLPRWADAKRLRNMRRRTMVSSKLKFYPASGLISEREREMTATPREVPAPQRRLAAVRG